MISVLIPYRNRPKHLPICLNALNQAAANSPDPVEVIVYDQSETPQSVYLKEPHLKLRFISKPQPATEPFHKSAALNDLICRAKGDLLTILDVDMVCQSHWLKAISDYFATPENRNKKLGHRVRLLDASTTKQFHLAPNYIERYAKMHQRINLAAEEYQGITTGNAICTMTADNFKSLNGYCEDFIGYGLEDWEMNLRAHKNGITTEILTTSDLCHLHHLKGQWGNDDLEAKNLQLFIKRKSEGFPTPPRPTSWDHERVYDMCFYSVGKEGFQPLTEEQE